MVCNLYVLNRDQVYIEKKHTFFITLYISFATSNSPNVNRPHRESSERTNLFYFFLNALNLFNAMNVFNEISHLAIFTGSLRKNFNRIIFSNHAEIRKSASFKKSFFLSLSLITSLAMFLAPNINSIYWTFPLLEYSKKKQFNLNRIAGEKTINSTYNLLLLFRERKKTAELRK